MTRIKNNLLVFAVFCILSVAAIPSSHAQTPPEVFEENSLKEQYDYLNDRTNIYNNYRAIREDMFQKIRRNSLDSLDAAFSEIRNLNQEIARLNEEKRELQNQLDQAIEERDAAVRERDSLSFLGLPMSKTVYNVVLWSIIGVLALILAIIFVLFKRAHAIASQKTREMKDLQNEYDEYRKSSRERFEKQSIDHFNEIKRLRGI